jgi:hypothetical protein
MAAAYLGFRTAGFRPVGLGQYLFIVIYWAIIVLTPIFIAVFINRAHISMHAVDSTLDAAPLKAWDILLPRMMAVVLSWLRLFLPLMVLAFALHELTFRGFHVPILSRIDALAGGFMFDYKYPGGFLEDTPQIGEEFKDWVIINAILRLAGWVLLAVTWGFWWGSIRRSGALAIVFGYVIGIGALVLIDVHDLYLIDRFLDLMTALKLHLPGWPAYTDLEKWFWIILRGWSGIILSIPALLMAVRLTGVRRR